MSARGESGAAGARSAGDGASARPPGTRDTRGGPAAVAAVSLALVLAIAAVYAPVRGHEYVDLDDRALLVWNPDMEPESLGEAFTIAFTRPQASGWVPLTTLSHQLDRHLWGRDASGALLTNMALHALGTLILLAALRRLTSRLAPSAFVAAVFALHPLHVESVAWAMARKDVLSGVFFAALLWLHARHAEAPDSRMRHAAVIGCLALGLLSKPTLVTAPAVLLLLDHWPLGRLDARAVREKLPLFAMSAGVALVTWLAQHDAGAMDFGTGLPLGARVENALDALVRYLGAAFWPTGLTAYYPHPGASLSTGRVLASAALLAALTGLAWRESRARPWLAVGWLWYVGMLVPVLGLVQVGMQARADRYTYLSLIGIALALAFTADRELVHRVARRGAIVAAVAATLALAVVARGQVTTWRDSRTLYQHMRSVHPQAAYPELRLGMVDAFEGRLERALPHLELAIALDSGAARQAVRQLQGLARFQYDRGRAADARRTLRFALDLARRTGQDEAETELRRILGETAPR